MESDIAQLQRLPVSLRLRPGEIRPVNRIEQRITEAEKLGFSRIIVPANNLKGFKSKVKIEIVQVKKVSDAFRSLFS